MWNYIPDADDRQTSLILDCHTGIWEALTLLLGSPSNRIRIKNRLKEQYKVCGYKELMTAYSDFKNRTP